MRQLYTKIDMKLQMRTKLLLSAKVATMKQSCRVRYSSCDLRYLDVREAMLDSVLQY